MVNYIRAELMVIAVTYHTKLPSAAMDYYKTLPAVITDYPKTIFAFAIVTDTIVHWIIGFRMKAIISFKEIRFTIIINSINLGNNLYFIIKIVLIDHSTMSY